MDNRHIWLAIRPRRDEAMKQGSKRFRPSRLSSLLAMAGWLAAFPSLAANTGDLTELSLEDLLQVEVTTASKYKQDSRETPSQVQVITADEIRQYGWRTLGEALGNLPGFYTSDDGVYQYLGARGFLTPGDYSTRFQLLLNGQRLNDNVYEQAQFGNPFPLDMALVERIEVISGPGSAIYGSNALFGVINVIARDPSAMQGSTGSVGVTTKGLRELRAAHRRAWARTDRACSLRSATPNRAVKISRLLRRAARRPWPMARHRPMAWRAVWAMARSPVPTSPCRTNRDFAPVRGPCSAMSFPRWPCMARSSTIAATRCMTAVTASRHRSIARSTMACSSLAASPIRSKFSVETSCTPIRH